MDGWQSVSVMGNLTADPELRYTQGGDPVCGFTLAVNRTFGGRDGSEKKEEVLFLKVNAWGKLAEVVGEHLKKGKRALVDGFLREHKWQTQEGENRSRIELTANRVVFLSPKTQGEGGGEPQDIDVPF